MTEVDLPEVEKTDAASFDPLWQNPLETLQRAFSQALYATVAENETGSLVIKSAQVVDSAPIWRAWLCIRLCKEGRGQGFAERSIRAISPILAYQDFL